MNRLISSTFVLSCFLFFQLLLFLETCRTNFSAIVIVGWKDTQATLDLNIATSYCFLSHFLSVSFQFFSISREAKMFFMSINRERRVMVNVILLMCAWSLSVTLIVPLMVGNGGAVRNGADGDAASWIQHLCPNYRTKPGSRDTLSWRPPSAQDIFFTQTSCAAALSIREVNTREPSLTETHLSLLEYRKAWFVAWPATQTWQNW